MPRMSDAPHPFATLNGLLQAATQLAQIGVDILLSLDKEVVIAQQLSGGDQFDRLGCRLGCGLRFGNLFFNGRLGATAARPCGWLLDL